MFVDTDLKIDLPQVELIIDRTLVADLGLSLAEINNQLSVLMSNNYVNRYNDNGKAYRVIPVVDNKEKFNPEQILDMQVTTPTGELVRVSSFAETKAEDYKKELERAVADSEVQVRKTERKNVL